MRLLCLRLLPAFFVLCVSSMQAQAASLEWSEMPGRANGQISGAARYTLGEGETLIYFKIEIIDESTNTTVTSQTFDRTPPPKNTAKVIWNADPDK